MALQSNNNATPVLPQSLRAHPPLTGPPPKRQPALKLMKQNPTFTTRRQPASPTRPPPPPHSPIPPPPFLPQSVCSKTAAHSTCTDSVLLQNYKIEERNTTKHGKGVAGRVRVAGAESSGARRRRSGCRYVVSDLVRKQPADKAMHVQPE